MKTTPVTESDIAQSVWAVPPLALGADLAADGEPNGRLIGHIEAGGITTLLYGANANIFNLPASAYGEVFAAIAGLAGAQTWVIPSAGPDYGKLLDCAPHLARLAFPAVLVLPNADPSLPQGIERGIREFVQRSATPAILYIRRSGYLAPERIEAMFADGTLVGIKYGVAPRDGVRDDELDRLCGAVGPGRVVSGMGEIVGVRHMADHGVGGFTAGAVCIGPRRSQAVLKAMQAGDRAAAERLAESLRAFEAVRDRISPIAVLHRAVTLAGLAAMGDLLPMMALPEPGADAEIDHLARAILEAEAELDAGGHAENAA